MVFKTVCRTNDFRETRFRGHWTAAVCLQRGSQAHGLRNSAFGMNGNTWLWKKFSLGDCSVLNRKKAKGGVSCGFVLVAVAHEQGTWVMCVGGNPLVELQNVPICVWFNSKARGGRYGTWMFGLEAQCTGSCTRGGPSAWLTPSRNLGPLGGHRRADFGPIPTGQAEGPSFLLSGSGMQVE